MAVRDELETLRDLHQTFAASAEGLTRIATNIDRSLGDTVWTGVQWETFLGVWQACRPTLTGELVDALHEAKEDVKTQHNNLAAATGEPDRI